MRIAVVIPTLNEAANLPATVAALMRGRPDAVVVADCDSTDDTVAIARSLHLTVLHHRGLSSRAAALQAGYEQVRDQPKPTVSDRGPAPAPPSTTQPFDTVFFLHADTIPPENWRAVIEDTLADPQVVGGAFAQRFSFTRHQPTWTQRRLLRFVTFCNRARYRVTGIYFGDQGIFVRAAALHAVGGVPQAPLMEDVDLCRALKKHGKLRVAAHARLSTSPRRFLRHGVLRQLLHDWLLLTLHHFRVNPRHMHQRYNDDNRDPGPAPIAH